MSSLSLSPSRLAPYRPSADPRPLARAVRRSNRTRVQPLEYWRNERAVYKRRQSGLMLEEVVRIPEEDKKPFASHNKRKGGGGRAGSAKVKHEEGKYGPPEEEGVDDATDPDGIVWSWEGNAEVSRRAFFPSRPSESPPLTLPARC